MCWTCGQNSAKPERGIETSAARGYYHERSASQNSAKPERGIETTPVVAADLMPGRQNSAKPERGIETSQVMFATDQPVFVRTALSPNAGLKPTHVRQLF